MSKIFDPMAARFLCLALVSILVLEPRVSQAGWFDKIFGYSTYEDCILGEIEGDESSAAASAIRRACRGKFPREKKQEAEFDWVFVGELKIIEKHWRFVIQDRTNKFGVSFKNNHRRKINAVVFRGQRDTSCSKDKSVVIQEIQRNVGPGNNDYFELWNAYSKFGTKKICVWVDGYQKVYR